MSVEKHNRNRIKDLEKKVGDLEQAVMRLYRGLDPAFDAVSNKFDDIEDEVNVITQFLEKHSGFRPSVPPGEQPPKEGASTTEA